MDNRVRRTPTYDRFAMALYVASSERILDVPLSKVFKDFLVRGVELVWINSYNYYSLAKHKKLNQYAKAYGVRFILQMVYDRTWGLDEQKMTEFIEENLRRLKAISDSDAVVGWAIGDEVENFVANLHGEERERRRRELERGFQRFSDLIRSLDPRRRVTVNHDRPNPRWLRCGEDESFCTTAYTGALNRGRICELQEEAKRHGFDDYFVVSQASSVPLGKENLAWHGMPSEVNDRVLAARTIAQEIRDYAETAYIEGSPGIMYFLYWAGSENYLPFTLVDANGDDHLGKWNAVLEASRNIRRWEGHPDCQINSPNDNTWATLPAKVSVNASSVNQDDQVQNVEIQVSGDHGLNWEGLLVTRSDDGSFTVVVAEEPLNTAGTLRVRARALNTRGHSLWDVIDISVLK